MNNVNIKDFKEVTKKIFNKVWDFAVEQEQLQEDEFLEEQTDVSSKKRYFVKLAIYNPWLESLKKAK